MKKRNNCNNIHLCSSCKHILYEESEIIESCDIVNNHTLDDLKIYCNICGQKINNNKESSVSQIELIKSAIKNPNLTVVAFTAPSIRVSISEAFYNGKVVECQGQINSALRYLGVDVVFDMNIGADFTILEESNEFVKRYLEKKNLPMMTSCCPGWVSFIKNAYPEYIKNLSTCKSPQQMLGALISKYYAKKINKKSTDLFVVSVVPCLVKKLEAKQPNINASKGFDVDATITTNELVELIKESNIDFCNLKPSKFDDFFGCASGAGAIFGTTGGVMESALRSIGDIIDKKDLDEAMYKLVRGQDGIRTASIKLKNGEIKLAIASGLVNAKAIMERIKNGEYYDFIEIMACPGGCVGGGGQPRNLENLNIIQERANVLYNSSDKIKKRKAHLNDSIINIYKKYIGDVGGKTAYRILHRKYK